MLPPSVLRRPSTYRSTSVPRPKGVQGATKDGARQGKGDTVEEEEGYRGEESRERERERKRERERRHAGRKKNKRSEPEEE